MHMEQSPKKAKAAGVYGLGGCREDREGGGVMDYEEGLVLLLKKGRLCRAGGL